MVFKESTLKYIEETNSESELVMGLVKDIRELVKALRYSNRFAKRDDTYDVKYVQDVLEDYEK